MFNVKRDCKNVNKAAYQLMTLFHITHFKLFFLILGSNILRIGGSIFLGAGALCPSQKLWFYIMIF